jgi:hypothetical protein
MAVTVLRNGKKRKVPVTLETVEVFYSFPAPRRQTPTQIYH